MAGSDNSRTLPSITRRNLIAGTATSMVATMATEAFGSTAPNRHKPVEGVGSGWGRNDTLSRCFLGPEIFAGQ